MNNTVLNIVVGKPLVEPWHLFAFSEQDWEINEKEHALFTNERNLPRVLLKAGIIPSISELRRNKPDLMKELNAIDFFSIKWGKKTVFIAVGE